MLLVYAGAVRLALAQEKSDNEPELTPKLEEARDNTIALALQARGQRASAALLTAGVHTGACTWFK